MPVDLQFRSVGWDTTVSVFHSMNGQEFSFVLSPRPDTVLLDPGNWILKSTYAGDSGIPAQVRLLQNFPNPFNAGTTITYLLPSRTDVTVTITDVLGREVVRLVNGRQEPGTQTVRWDGRDAAGIARASGIYFYKLTTSSTAQTGKMLLLR
jgi:hypothetical protein